MRIWEVDPQSHWAVLDHYASVAEDSDDLIERMIGLYLRDKAKGFEEDNE